MPSILRACLVLVSSVSMMPGSAALPSAADVPAAEAALLQNDECAAAVGEDCALNALQRRGVRSTAADDGSKDVAEPKLDQGAASGLGSKQLPGEVSARADEGSDVGGDDMDPSVVQKEAAPRTEVEQLLEERAARSEEGTVLGGDEMDPSLSRKEAGNKICAHASEGQTCVPNSHGHSNSYIYCSAHKVISPSATSCEQKRGHMSWCVGGGYGLTHDDCDDPFCRNGGAYAGSGRYCHGGSVVSCSGQNAPVVQNPCSSTSQTDGCCTITTHYTCAGSHPNPYCKFSSTTSDCSSCDSDSDSRRRYGGYDSRRRYSSYDSRRRYR